MFNETQTTTHIDTIGEIEGLMVIFANGEGIDDAVLAKVVVFGKPVDNSDRLGADVVLFNLPVKTELVE